MKKNIVESIGDKLTYWNGGFHSKKNDPGILVPKSSPGIGWTINFGNPKAVKLLILTILLIVGVIVAYALIFGLHVH